MPSESFTQFLEEEVRSHLQWLSVLHSFSRDNNELAESLANFGHVDDHTHGLEIIEGFLEKNPSLYDGKERVPLLRGSWFAKYHYIHDMWIFDKALDYERIIHEAMALESAIKKELGRLIKGLSPENFEYMLFELFSSLEEYNEPTKRTQTRDGGYEMSVSRPHRITGSQEFILIQAKHQTKKVSVSQVRELIGTLDTMSNLRRSKRFSGLMVSIHGQTKDAVDTAANSTKRIDFLDLDGLVDVMFQNRVGWIRRELQFAAPDPSFWDDWSDGDE